MTNPIATECAAAARQSIEGAGLEPGATKPAATQDGSRVATSTSPRSIVPRPAPARPARSDAERLARCLGWICGEGYAHQAPNLAAPRREALAAGRAWPSCRELLAGQTFHRVNFHEDLAKSCRLLLKYEPLTVRHLAALDVDVRRARRLQRIAQDLFAQIRALARHADIAALRALPQILTRWRQTLPPGHWDIFSQPEVRDRLEFYLACAWDQQAQANIASACLREALRHPDSAAAKLGFRAAMGWLRFSTRECGRALRGDTVISGMTAALEGDSVCFPVLHRVIGGNVFRLLTGRFEEPSLEPAPAAAHPAAAHPAAAHPVASHRIGKARSSEAGLRKC